MDDARAREDLVAAVARLDQLGLNRGSTGNLSVRAAQGGFWITPTGMPPEEITPRALVRLANDGTPLEGDWVPSSEWPFHRAIYSARDELGAVVHIHSPHATALA